MSRCATMKAKLTSWETSGRRSTTGPSAPAHALEDSRYDTSASHAFGLMFSDMYIDLCFIQRVNLSMFKGGLCLFGLIRAGDVITAADQVVMWKPVRCSLLEWATQYA